MLASRCSLLTYRQLSNRSRLETKVKATSRVQPKQMLEDSQSLIASRPLRFQLRLWLARVRMDTRRRHQRHRLSLDRSASPTSCLDETLACPTHLAVPGRRHRAVQLSLHTSQGLCRRCLRTCRLRLPWLEARRFLPVLGRRAHTRQAARRLQGLRQGKRRLLRQRRQRLPRPA